MNEPNEQWGRVVRETAVSLDYPPTPDIAGAVRRLADPLPERRAASIPPPAWALIVLLVIAGLLLAVPPARAAVWEFIRAGAITIFVGDEEALAPAEATADWAAAEFAGLTSLADARVRAGFPLYLPPAYGLPDDVYLQEILDPGLDGQVVIMAWRDPAQPATVQLRLFQIDVPYYGFKSVSVESVASTQVHGQEAFWIEGGHRIRLQDGAGGESYFVTRNVLIWEERAITYRLESALSLEEARQLAESLAPVEESEE